MSEKDFNSLPHAEVDVNGVNSNTVGLQNFNSLPHAEVDQDAHNPLRILHNFNSLPHAEVDGDYYASNGGYLEFQLTTSRRGRPDQALPA